MKTQILYIIMATTITREFKEEKELKNHMGMNILYHNERLLFDMHFFQYSQF
jgi:hypothetical protein